MIQLACMLDLGLICGPVLGIGVVLCGAYRVSTSSKEVEPSKQEEAA